MSSELLYPTRLWWCAGRGRGIARHEGVEVQLHHRPPVMLPMGRLVELEYSPGAGVAYYQLAMTGQVDMTPEQMRECLRYLRAIALAARTAADVGAAR
ncbi:MAG: hypothetical protein LC099_06690 [Anaerolineales bacterium]|nr:hypothetical protein [Anaerolineales bacterium]